MLALSTKPFGQDYSARFNREVGAFVEACRRGDAREMASAAGSLRQLASPQREVEVLCCEAEAALALGQRSQAIEAVDAAEVRSLQAGDVVAAVPAWIVRAKVALADGLPEPAAELAGRARRLLRERRRPEWAALIVLAQAKRLQGIPWTFPHDVASAPADPFWRLAVEIERARDSLCAHPQEAMDLSRAAFITCKMHGYESLAARAAATAGACGLALREDASGWEWVLCALSCLLRTGDSYSAHDLLEFGGIEAGASAFRNLRDGLTEKLLACFGAVLPQLSNDGDRQQCAARAFIRAMLDVVSDGLPYDSLVAAIARLRETGSVLVRYAGGRARELAEPIVLALVALTARSGRTVVERRVRAAMEFAIDALAPEDRHAGLTLAADPA